MGQSVVIFMDNSIISPELFCIGGKVCGFFGLTPHDQTYFGSLHGLRFQMGTFAPQQPVMFNPQVAPIPQPYYHPNGPQYGQQMMGQPHRPVLYTPTYPPEMSYKGREF